MYRGEFVYTYLQDLGGELQAKDASALLAASATGHPIEASKSAPPYVGLARPLRVALAPRGIRLGEAEAISQMEAHVYPIGAAALVLRIPFAVATLQEVHRLSLFGPEGIGRVEAMCRETMNGLLDTLRPALIETYEAVVEAETYLITVLTETERPAIELLGSERQLLAGLVAGEKRPERLSAEEVEDNLRTWYQYYADDLVVVDWERALIIEPGGRYDDVLAVMESANLELLELRVYDRYLDTVLDKSYGELTRFYGRGGLFRSARDVQEDLSNARIDLVRVTDTINNIGKIFGDYYLAKIHLGLAQRFHLGEWEAIVREKMATLNELYTLASHEVEHRRGVVLESMIILLFVIDLVLIYLVSGG